MTTLVRCSLLLIGIIGASRVSSAATFSDIFIFGDSISDTGRIFEATFGLIPPDPPFHQGRFSDGPIWPDFLAAHLGLTVTASDARDPTNIDGNNFAVGIARAAIDLPAPPFGTIPSVLTQALTFLTFGPASPPADALYVVYAGNNDLRFAVDPANNHTAAQQAQFVDDAVASIAATVTSLAAAGAKHIVVPNVGDLGATPEAGPLVRDNATASTAITLQFNAALANALGSLALPADASLLQFDFYALGKDIVDDATNHGGATYGITNIDTPIFPGFAGSTGADPATSLFADDLHPSSAAHAVFADALLRAIPEPSTCVLAALGCAVFGCSYRRPRRGSAIPCSNPLP